MASGDSAIEIIEMSQDPDHIVADHENSSPEHEPLEEDVFLPTTPEPKSSKISARAHSTPRPVGSLTDSDVHLRTNMLANYTTNNTPFDGNMNREAQAKSGHKLFLFCVALVAMSILAGFFAGYFVREKVFERELVSNLDDETDPKITGSAEVRKMYHQQAVGNISDDRIADYVSIYSRHECQSGTPCSQSMSAIVEQQLRDMGFTNVDVSSYSVLTSHPDMSRMSSLRTVNSDGQEVHLEVLYGSSQDGRKDDGQTENQDRMRRMTDEGQEVGIDQSNIDLSNRQSSTVMYMPFSATGQAEGELVYVYYATQGDFLMLSQNKINVTGKIAIARQGTMMVTDQVRNVEEQGMTGLILYTDPADMDVIMTMGTERLVGMTGMMGDPLTLGCPAMDGINRMTMIKAGLPSIPVQPISPELATSLLSNMTGRMAPSGWQGGLNITYYMGRKNSKKSTWTVELDVSNNKEQQAVHDVITTITGTHMPDEYIILGGHFFNMMSAVAMAGMTSGHGSLSMLMEAATVMSQMMAEGWKPKRTIVLGMWGGAEYGHAGSMEWVEEHRDILTERAVSYIDLDTVMGDVAMAETSPLLKGVIMEAIHMLELTDIIQPGMLNGVGDHVAFSHMLGIPSARLYATHNMQQGSATGSPTQSMHMSVTKLATQTVLLLADSDVIPFDVNAMSDMLMGYVGSLDSKMGDILLLSNMTIDNLKMAVSDFMDTSMEMKSMMGDLSMMKSSVIMTMVNHRLMYMERAFVNMDPSGSMTHILYGMTEMDTFSLVADYSPNNMNNETMTTMMERVSIIQCTIQSATLSLKMDIS